MALYSAFRCALSDLQNNEKRLISNDLRFCVANLLMVAFVILFHTSRHTFASTVTLANNISLDVVSKMLGHTNTRMTAHYAKLVDESIAKQMDQIVDLFD